MIIVDASSFDPQAPIEWCAMSDERPEVSTRRDATRPVRALSGMTVQVWGCGGIGSWIAEFIVRAGASHVVVCDPAAVGGGLLVRQNYTEGDVGVNKAEALAGRLRELSDTVQITAVPEPCPDLASVAECDLVVDATVNLGIGDLLDTYTRDRDATGPVIAAVATDSRSATLGILTIARAAYLAGPTTIDRLTADRVLDDPNLTRYHPLWQTPTPGEELIPARGCSTPTFHGSAADLAGVAAVLVSLLGRELTGESSGTHLVGLPHADVDGPAHWFVPAPDPD